MRAYKTPPLSPRSLSVAFSETSTHTTLEMGRLGQPLTTIVTFTMHLLSSLLPVHVQAQQARCH